MNIEKELVGVLDEVLSLDGRAAGFTAATPLLGAIPELDSMAVVSLITALEERFDMVVNDDDIDGSVFATLGSLTEFVRGKLAA
ncbi:acyl carrier protein [Aquabacterium humicola]|jgi:acyl carrier protein|uniref:acyl carrier protein n=1 Tax=Aquabacterium humicola TaxID=3237377 RepID=UPI00254301A9|nr:acyl carrier protein [Rubrivivax pictus]